MEKIKAENLKMLEEGLDEIRKLLVEDKPDINKFHEYASRICVLLINLEKLIIESQKVT